MRLKKRKVKRAKKHYYVSYIHKEENDIKVESMIINISYVGNNSVNIGKVVKFLEEDKGHKNAIVLSFFQVSGS